MLAHFDLLKVCKHRYMTHEARGIHMYRKQASVIMMILREIYKFAKI